MLCTMSCFCHTSSGDASIRKSKSRDTSSTRTCFDSEAVVARVVVVAVVVFPRGDRLKRALPLLAAVIYHEPG